ncbi:MAG: PAS domain S-box protein, partial [Syntrophobacterales bacterium]
KDLINELAALRRRVSDLEGEKLRGKPKDFSLEIKREDDRDLLIDHISDGVFRLNRDGYFTFVNKVIVDRSGISSETFCALHFLDIVMPEDQREAKDKFEKVFAGETVAPFDVTYRVAGDHTITVKVNSSAIYEGGKIVGLQAISRDLTERKLAAEAISENEERFRKMIQNSTDAVSLFSPEGTFLYMSEAIGRILGYHPEEMVGQTWESFVHPDDFSLIANKVADLLEQAGNIETAECRARHRDGSWRWVDIVGSNQVDKPGIGAIILNFRDITERKLAEEAIAAGEHRFQELFENMSSCMAVYAAVGDCGDFIFRDFNKSAEKAEQIDRNDLIGKSLLETFPGVREMGLFDVFQRVWRTGKPEQYPATLYKDGRIEGWKENYVYKLPSGEIVAIYDDVTEHRQAEIAAKESEERFRSLFDRSLECIYSHDLEGNFLDANQSTLDLLGYDREDILSLNFASLLPPEQLPQAMRQLEEIVRGGFQKEIKEYKIRRKDGKYLDFETRASLVYHDGNPQAILGIASDITERKQSVDRLRKAIGATVQAMAVVVETRDPYTAGHQRRVADLARSIASVMGLSASQIDGIRTAASIHDIGKISIPAEILSKPSKLSDTEFSLIKLHPQSGYDILKDIEFPWPVARIVLEHHERIDGLGYPNGLRGEEILLESRIISLADVVEAIASHRPYRPSLGIDLALEEIANNRGTQFDPGAVDACLRLFNEKGYKFLGD